MLRNILVVAGAFLLMGLGLVGAGLSLAGLHLDPRNNPVLYFRVIFLAVLPAVSLALGVFVGVLARSQIIATTAISLVPVAGLVVVSLWASAPLEGVLWGVVYVALACAASVSVGRLRAQRNGTMAQGGEAP